MIERCATCRFWGDRPGAAVEIEEYDDKRVCGASIPPMPGSSPEQAAMRAEGMGGYPAELLTAAEFGCVLWQSKPLAEGRE